MMLGMFTYMSGPLAKVLGQSMLISGSTEYRSNYMRIVLVVYGEY